MTKPSIDRHPIQHLPVLRPLALPQPTGAHLLFQETIVTHITEEFVPHLLPSQGLASVVTGRTWEQARTEKLRTANTANASAAISPESLAQREVAAVLREYQAYQRVTRQNHGRVTQDGNNHLLEAARHLLAFRQIVGRGQLTNAQITEFERQIGPIQNRLIGPSVFVTATLLRAYDRYQASIRFSNLSEEEGQTDAIRSSNQQKSLAMHRLAEADFALVRDRLTQLSRLRNSPISREQRALFDYMRLLMVNTPALYDVVTERSARERLNQQVQQSMQPVNNSPLLAQLEILALRRDYLRSHPHDPQFRAMRLNFQTELSRVAASFQQQAATLHAAQRALCLAKLDELSSFSGAGNPNYRPTNPLADLVGGSLVTQNSAAAMLQRVHDANLGVLRQDNRSSLQQAQFLLGTIRENISEFGVERSNYLFASIANDTYSHRIRMINAYSEAAAAIDLLMSIPENSISPQMRMDRNVLRNNIQGFTDALISLGLNAQELHDSVSTSIRALQDQLNRHTGVALQLEALSDSEIPQVTQQATALLNQRFEFERTSLGGSLSQARVRFYTEGDSAPSLGQVALNPRNMGVAFERCRLLHELQTQLSRIQNRSEAQETLFNRITAEKLRIDMGLRERGFEFSQGEIRAIHSRNYTLAMNAAREVNEGERMQRAIQVFEGAAILCARGERDHAAHALQILYTELFRNAWHSQPSMQREIFTGVSPYALNILHNSNHPEIRRWMGMLHEGYTN